MCHAEVEAKDKQSGSWEQSARESGWKEGRETNELNSSVLVGEGMLLFFKGHQ